MNLFFPGKLVIIPLKWHPACLWCIFSHYSASRMNREQATLFPEFGDKNHELVSFEMCVAVLHLAAGGTVAVRGMGGRMSARDFVRAREAS